MLFFFGDTYSGVADTDKYFFSLRRGPGAYGDRPSRRSKFETIGEEIAYAAAYVIVVKLSCGKEWIDVRC